MAKSTTAKMRALTTVMRALASTSRVRALLLLLQQTGERTVGEIVNVLGLDYSTVTKHLKVLYRAGIVERRRSGRNVLYRLAGDEARPLVRDALQLVREHL